MTEYEVKSYMSQCWRIKIEMRAKYTALLELRSQAENTSANLTGMPSSHNEGSKVENYAIALVTMRDDLQECEDKLYKVQQQTLRMIELASDPLMRAMLTEYHINGKKLDATAESIGYSTRQTIRIMNRAYKEIAEKMSLNVM